MYQEALDRKREAGGLTVIDLAAAAGIGPNTISAIINGRRAPHRRTIHKLAAALGCTPADIGFADEEGRR